MNELRECPFCGGGARISFRQAKFIGQNEITGKKKIRWYIQVICNRCKSRGKPVATVTTVNLWEYPHFRISDKDVDPVPWIETAIAAWNKRHELENKPLTNADRIRSMTDEELAGWYGDTAIKCRAACNKQKEDLSGYTCYKCILYWLKQPVKEETL